MIGPRFTMFVTELLLLAVFRSIDPVPAIAVLVNELVALLVTLIVMVIGARTAPAASPPTRVAVIF